MSFFLGRSDKETFTLEAKDLCTHAVCMGMTGSGKTGLGIGLLEEAALAGIPAIIIDPKGDLGNLCLAFPDLAPSDFEPWVNGAEAERKGLSKAAFASQTAEEWKNGLASWGEDKKRIQAYKDAVSRTIYTPANTSGVPLSILNSFSAPSDETLSDPSALRDRILSTTSSLLGLLGVDADPIKSKEHILISAIFENLWKNKQSLDLTSLIRHIQNPPFTQVGAFDLNTFYAAKERLNLAMALNNLLASTGFQAWMEGEPMDIERLLYTPDGKPRHSILYIAHLSDQERMFFVTLLLNEILSWMRKQPGTPSLSALLYMDEIFGFFPAVANPPSKLPMISLLKQARAFGLGIVLCTQNPIDLDYRGLGNCGTWFIGKLQTERDRLRIIDGLQAASNGNMDTSELNDLLSKCKKRHFLVQSIHKQEPILFETRWTLSYLAGPLTLPQIQQLTEKVTKIASKVLPKSTAKPLLPSGIQEYIIKNAPSDAILTAYVLGIAKLHFVDAANRCDLWVDKIIAAPLTENGKDVDWEKGSYLENMDNLTNTFPKDGSFKDVPPSLHNQETYNTFKKSLFQYLYQNATLDFFTINALKMTSKPNESQDEFLKRAESTLSDKAEEATQKLNSLYKGKIEALQTRIQRAQSKIAESQERASKRKIDAWISVGKTILAGLFSRKISKTDISNIGTTLKKVGNATDADVSEEGIKALINQISELENNQAIEAQKIREEFSMTNVHLEKTQERPKKSDLVVNEVGILWMP